MTLVPEHPQSRHTRRLLEGRRVLGDVDTETPGRPPRIPGRPPPPSPRLVSIWKSRPQTPAHVVGSLGPPRLPPNQRHRSAACGRTRTFLGRTRFDLVPSPTVGRVGFRRPRTYTHTRAHSGHTPRVAGPAPDGPSSTALTGPQDQTDLGRGWVSRTSGSAEETGGEMVSGPGRHGRSIPTPLLFTKKIHLI